MIDHFTDQVMHVTKFKLKLLVPRDFGHWGSPRRVAKTVEAEFKGVSDARRKAIDLIEHCEDPYASVSIQEYSYAKIIGITTFNDIGDVVFRNKTNEYEWKEYGSREGMIGYGLIRVSLLNKNGSIKQKTWENGVHLNEKKDAPLLNEINKSNRFVIYEKDNSSRTRFRMYAPSLNNAINKICSDDKCPFMSCYIIYDGKKKLGLFVRYTIIPKDQNGDYHKKCVNVFKEYVYKGGKIQSYKHTTINEDGSKHKSTDKEIHGTNNALSWYGYKFTD